jgi:hypothetical protein
MKIVSDILIPIATAIGDFFRDHGATIANTALIGGTVFIVGYGSQKYVESKQGIIIHDQGYEMIKQPNGNFRMWVSDNRYPEGPGSLQTKEYDLYNKPREFTNYIAGVGKERFPNTDASSYADIYLGDTAFKYVYYDRYTVHAALFNSPTIGECLVRTNDEELNKRTLQSFVRNQPQINDTLLERYDNGIQFSLFHSDHDPVNKEDPHEYRPELERLGFRYDDRVDFLRIDFVPRKNSTE